VNGGGIQLTEALFWISAFMLFYAFQGYSLLIRGLAFVRPRPVRQDPCTPPVSLIVSAHNEEAVIGEKIENCLNLNYPAHRLEIILASDGSNDRTTEIAHRYEKQGVKVLDIKQQQGKSLTLNEAVRMAKGHIVVFTDANAIFAPNTLLTLVRNFSLPAIGFVTGWTRYKVKGESESDGATKAYGNQEALIKEKESLFGSCVGADGAIFAIRRELYLMLEEADINDLVIPFQIILQGYRGILEKEAVCEEVPDCRPEQTLSRQIRITTRTIRAILSYSLLLNPLKFGWFSIQLLSHKVLRLCAPFLLILVFATNLLLVMQSEIYVLSLVMQGLFYTCAWIGFLLKERGRMARVFSLPFYFVMVNWAVLVAWVRVLQGKTDTMWTPSQRVLA
jgi:cellulose synthase/poly-beta-1,6-N-acetylglucosamine synthase-like glycosyltransferase